MFPAHISTNKAKWLSLVSSGKTLSRNLFQWESSIVRSVVAIELCWESGSLKLTSVVNSLGDLRQAQQSAIYRENKGTFQGH